MHGECIDWSWRSKGFASRAIRCDTYELVLKLAAAFKSSLFPFFCLAVFRDSKTGLVELWSALTQAPYTKHETGSHIVCMWSRLHVEPTLDSWRLIKNHLEVLLPTMQLWFLCPVYFTQQ